VNPQTPNEIPDGRERRDRLVSALGLAAAGCFFAWLALVWFREQGTTAAHEWLFAVFFAALGLACFARCFSGLWSVFRRPSGQ
jgi:hypothetical protein